MHVLTPQEMTCLKLEEVPRLFKLAKYSKIEKLADRLVHTIVHCPDMNASMNNPDMNAVAYRDDVLLTSLWMRDIVACNGPPQVASVDQLEAMKRFVLTPLDDVVANNACLAWLLRMHANTLDADLYSLTRGRCFAIYAYRCVASYQFKTCIANVEKCEADSLKMLLTNMAKNCEWVRTKDSSLFHLVKSRLTACRQARLHGKMTPMYEIVEQLDRSDTNRVVGGFIATDIKNVVMHGKYTSSRATELFVQTVGLLAELLDVDVRLLVNVEVPQSTSMTVPSFVVLSSNFATQGTVIGYCWDSEIYVVPASVKYPILATIVGWLELSMEVVKDPAVYTAVHEAIYTPDVATVTSHIMFKFTDRGFTPLTKNGMD
jgi:hypothetical protein